MPQGLFGKRVTGDSAYEAFKTDRKTGLQRAADPVRGTAQRQGD